jgi:hypothetical protein
VVFLALAFASTACGRSPLETRDGGDSLRRDARACGDASCAKSEICLSVEYSGAASLPECYPRQGCDTRHQACLSLMCEPTPDVSHCVVRTNGKGTPTECYCE